MPVPSPSPSPSSGPAASGCRYGYGTLDTACSREAERFEAEINAAIDRVAEKHADYFDMANARGPGEWKVLRPADYLAAVVGELPRAFCGETDGVRIVSLRDSAELSESYDVLHPTDHVRRGRTAYQRTCRPPDFPVDPKEAIAYVRVHFYAIECEPGVTAPRNGENVLPIGCRGLTTATPKQRNNEDVPRHIVGGDVSWRLEQSGEIVDVHDYPEEAFNKIAVPKNAGRYTLCATSHGVEGCQEVEVPEPRR